MSRFHRRAALVAGVGFFTDAYDLFVIATVALLARDQWHLGTTETSWVTGAAILGAFFGALTFGRIADRVGRKVVFRGVAVVMIVGAVLSAVAPDLVWLIAARFVLGLGIGGDYPVSATLMTEFAGRDERGKLVGLVFSMQAVGLVVGPLVAISLLASGLGHGVTWRLLLGLGALPAAATLYLRWKMPESPRFEQQRAQRRAASASDGVITVLPVKQRRTGELRRFLTDPKMIPLVIGTAGGWFLLDYAYYGNTLSAPAILKAVDPAASLITNLALTLAMFVVFAVPGYALAVLKMDRVGHRRLQLLGFSVMAVAFAALGVIGGPLTSMVVPFAAIFGVSYFFIEFGPNTTTFVLPSEVFPTRVRATGHGFAAGIGKLGAFVGVFLVPVLQSAVGLRGMLLVAAGAAVAGWAVTHLLPEPALRGLDEVSKDDEVHFDEREPRSGGGASRAPLPGAARAHQAAV